MFGYGGKVWVGINESTVRREEFVYRVINILGDGGSRMF